MRYNESESGPVKIIWTRHAVERQQAWEVSKGITRQEIEDLVANPDQLVPGDLGALVAQTQRGGGLLRVPFVQMGDSRKILTIYWTSKVDKYWKEE
jgi:hypothetical protein